MDRLVTVRPLNRPVSVDFCIRPIKPKDFILILPIGIMNDRFVLTK